MNIPSGNVTFLFTDIEGSTKLAQKFPETLPAALERHNAILTEVIESNNGFVFEIVGDAFCCAFEKAEDAVKAAVDAQLNLSKENWNDAVIKIRIGIHSGNSEWNGNSYMGYITLARAARVMSSGYGEQILLSNNTFELLKEKIHVLNKKNFTFRDLGERRLKDVIQPVKLFQIEFPGFRDEFPPLKTLDARPNNIPIQLTNFIGRENEMSEIKNLLANTRLLTFLGPGGTGKTRLSMQVAADIIDEFENGVFIAELASVTDPKLIVQTVMNSLGVKEKSGYSPEDALIDFLKSRELLLILDNCEHLVIDSANLSEMLLSKCPKLKIIATSREALNCSGETAHKVPALSLPDPGENNSPESLTQFEAVRLFIERALVINQNFRVTNENAPALAQICFHLDGIPLAIELAAARVSILTLEGINERLKDRFKFLTGGKRTALPRQQTLKALVDWSYDLLSEKEKLLFQRLTIFSGGWTLEAAEKICSDESLDEFEVLDFLSNLTDKSLVKVYETENSVRYTMLETIKKYGDEKLIQSGEKNTLLEKYFEFFYTLSENSEKHLTGSDQKEWLIKIESENGNLRECLKWSSGVKPEASLKMAAGLGKFWELRGYFTEALEYLKTRLERTNSADLLWKAKAAFWTGFFLTNQAKYPEAKQYLNQSLGLFREINNKEGEALVLMSLGTIALFQADYENLNFFCGESLTISRAINNKSYIARNLQNTAIGLMQLGKHDEARKKFEEGLSFYRELNDSAQIAKIIGNIGVLEFLLRNFDKARIAYAESLKIRKELGDRQGISIVLSNLGSVALEEKKFDESEKYIEESLEIIIELGDRRIYVTTLTNLGFIAFYKKDFSKAVKLLRESVNLSYELEDKYSLAKSIEGFANLFLEQNNFPDACRLSANYFSLLKASNKNIIEGEIIRIEEIKNILKNNLSVDEFETYWSQGESMTAEEAIKFIS